MKVSCVTHDSLSSSVNEDIVSPELALVDPVLAEHARSWLPHPDDTLARVERIVRAQRIAASRARRMEELRFRDSSSAAAAAERASRASRTTADRRSAAIAGGVTAIVVVAALLVGVRIDLGGDPADADSTAIAEASAAVPEPEAPRTVSAPETPTPNAKSQGPWRPPKAPTPHRSPPRPSKAPTPRRFVWAPAARASGYDVAFFRGSSLVFSAKTKRPDVSLPASWMRGGKRQTLEPGAYRWYVWPVVSGRRASEAIVQAELVLPRR